MNETNFQTGKIYHETAAVVENGNVYFIRTDHIRWPPLTQNWMRDYDPTTGRYIQADPLGLVDGASVYGYARQNPGRYADPSGLRSEPSIWDQFNPFGMFGDSSRNYTDYYNRRFPNSVEGAKRELIERIKKRICLSKLLPKLPGFTGRSDIDINPNMQRFGDRTQSFWERRMRLGHFEFKTDDINIDWSTCPECYRFKTTMYVSENTGEPYTGIFKERRLREAEWPLNGGGCCDF